jgi:hypothetical protein
LADFLKEKAQSYAEPTRAGTPRGERVGLSAAKYAATLLALTSSDLKHQAKTLGVSYGLLRKWRTEAAFTEQVDGHAREFVERFFQRAREQVDESQVEIPLSPSAAIAVAQNMRLKNEREPPDFGDRSLYSRDLFHRLMIRYGELEKFNPDLNPADAGARNLFFLHLELLTSLELIDKAQGGKGFGLQDRLLRDRGEILRLWLKEAIKLLSSDAPTEADRARGVFYLTLMEGALEREAAENSAKSSK